MKNATQIKRLLALLLSVSMIFSMLLLTGCGDKKSEDEDNDEKPGVSDDGGYKNEKAEEGRADFIDELGGVSETYTGAVSETSYESAEDAARAFVATEIVGNKEATVESVKSEGELSTKEVNDLKLPDDVKKGMLSVEKLEVSYSVEDLESAYANGSVVPCAAEKTNSTVIVYVIKYETNWKYYSPAPINGNTITKSYYDSVFNAEKYKNCTLESESTISLNVVGTDGTETYTVVMEISAKQLIKHAGNKVYAEISTTTKMSQNGVENVTPQNIYLYLEENGDSITCYVKTSEDGEWVSGSLNTIGFTSVDQLTPFYDQYLDYSYFTKTSFGFAIEKENARQYLKETLAAMSSMFPTDFNQNDLNIDMYAEYYVADGVLSGMRTDAQIDFSMVEDGVTATAEESVVGITTVTNYGTTVVESPVAN